MLCGSLIKESLNDDVILDMVEIENVSLFKNEATQTYNTLVKFKTEALEFPKKLSYCIGDDWFCEMVYREKVKVLVFKNKVLQYTLGNEQERNSVLKYCSKIGVPEAILNDI